MYVRPANIYIYIYICVYIYTHSMYVYHWDNVCALLLVPWCRAGSTMQLQYLRQKVNVRTHKE